MLISGGVVWQSSNAAFTASTSNAGNTFQAGSVGITDSDNGTTMFSLTNMAPGDNGSTCMAVSYTGSLSPTAIRMYFANAQESNGAVNSNTYSAWTNASATSETDAYLSLQVEVSSTELAADPGGNFGSNYCAAVANSTFSTVVPSTLTQTLINNYSSYASNLSAGWGTVTTGKWRIFRFTWAYSSGATNSAQGDGLKFDIVWEAQR